MKQLVILTLMALSVNLAQAATIPYKAKPIASYQVLQEIIHLERRIATVDSMYQPFVAQLDGNRISYAHSMVYQQSETGRVSLVILGLVDPADNKRLSDVLILTDPFIERSKGANNTEYLKYQMLKSVFSAPGLTDVLKASTGRFTVAQGDFFTLSYIHEFLRLKGLRDIQVEEGKANVSVRSLVAKNMDQSAYRSGTPTFDYVLTKSLNLIDQAVETSDRLHYEVVTSLEGEFRAPTNACYLLFN